MSTRFQFDAQAIVPQPPPAEGTEPAPQWNKLFPLGTFHRHDFPKGGITFDAEFLSAMVVNWTRSGRPALPIDYMHRGDSSGPLPVEEKVASGWIEDLQLLGDGLYGLFRWTARARGFILADELRYLSPTFAVNAMDRRTGKAQGPTLFGAALLNDPFLQDLPRVAASSTHPAEEATTTADEAPPRSNKMDPKKIRLALGLAEDATDEAVEARAAELTKLEAAAKEEGEKLRASNGAATEKLQAAQSALTAQADEAKKLAARVLVLEEEKAETERGGLVRDLLKDGRITAAQGEQVKSYAKAMGLDEARKFFASMPQVVQLGETGVSGRADDAEPHKKHAALVLEAKQKFACSASDAARRVNREHPELAKAISLTLNATPAAELDN
jgi:phage I-like protein